MTSTTAFTSTAGGHGQASGSRHRQARRQPPTVGGRTAHIECRGAENRHALSAADVRTVGPMAYATASPADHRHGRMDQSIVLTFGEHRGWCMYPPVDPYGDGYVAHIRV